MSTYQEFINSIIVIMKWDLLRYTFISLVGLGLIISALNPALIIAVVGFFGGEYKPTKVYFRLTVFFGLIVLIVGLYGLIFLLNHPPYISDIKISPEDHATVGNPVILTANASDPNGDKLYYEFKHKNPKSPKNEWDNIRGLMDNNETKWIIEDDDVGINEIMVFVTDRIEGDLDKKEANSSIQYKIMTINSPPKIKDFFAQPANQTAGKVVRLRIDAEDNDNDIIYCKFLKYNSTIQDWEVTKDWRTDRSWLWTTTPRDIGENWIKTQVRDNNSTIIPPYEKELDNPVVIIPPL